MATYADCARLARDGDFRERLRTCMVAESMNERAMDFERLCLQVALEPQMGDKYAAALARHIDRPGLYEEVISDGMILASVHAVLKNNPPTS